LEANASLRIGHVDRSRGSHLVAFSTASLLLLTGCGVGDTGEAESHPVSSQATFNDADVRFVIDAGWHLGQSVTAARMVLEQTSDPTVRSLARKVVHSKGWQADTVAALVRKWGKQGAALGHADAPAGDDSIRSVGFTDQVIARLASASGRRLDHLFLSKLAEHLHAGRSIWETEQEGGQNRAATDLAAQVLTEDQAQLATVARLLDR
jgi:uncharacterized protein (DUF305 family)